MDDPHGILTPWFRRLKNRFAGDADEDGESSAKSGWKRYGSLVQLLFVVAAAFGGVIWRTASTVLDGTASLARTSGPVLSGFLWPILIGVTAVAVAVCVVVVVLGVRNA